MTSTQIRMTLTRGQKIVIGTFLFLTIFNFLFARFQLPVRNTYHPCKERGGCGDYVHPQLRLHLERSQQWLTGETQPDLAIESWPMWVQRSLHICNNNIITQYNPSHSEGCFHACPSPPSMCNGAVQVVPATQLRWQGDIISKIWPNYNCASVKMSWWTTGASLGGILFQKAVVKIQCNALQCSQLCSWSHFSFLCCPFPLADI